jgi:hypothetical protein
VREGAPCPPQDGIGRTRRRPFITAVRALAWQAAAQPADKNMFAAYPFTCNFWADWEVSYETHMSYFEGSTYLTRPVNPCTRKWRVQHELVRHVSMHAHFWRIWAPSWRQLRSTFDEHCGSMEEDGDSSEGSQYGDCAIADAPPCRFCGEAGCCAPPGECVPDLLGLLSQ